MEDARKGDISSVVVYSFSRFARSTQHLLSALETFKSLDVGFISLSENIDTGNPMGKAVFIIISAISQLERELISERVKIGLENARAKGKQIGRQKTRNSKLIQELHGSGMSMRKIAKMMGISSATVFREIKG